MITVLVLFLGKDTSSSVLFTGLSQGEAAEIARLLQGEDIMIPKQNIGEFIKQNPHIAAKVYAKLAERLNNSVKILKLYIMDISAE